MKKILLFLICSLVIIFFTSCDIKIIINDENVIEEKTATCLEEGYKIYTKNGITYKDVYQALGHDYACETIEETYYKYTCNRCEHSYQVEINHQHVFGESDNYIIIQKCQNCEYVGRIPSTNSFKEKFTYIYTDKDKENFDKIAAEVEELISQASTSKSLNKLCDEVIDKIDDLCEVYEIIEKSYYFAEVKYYQDNTDEDQERYFSISEIKNLMEVKIYNLEYQIFNSKLKNEYFEGEDLNEIENYLKSYADDTVATLSTTIDELGETAYYEDVENEKKFYSDVETLISERNKLAKIFDYDNYYDYAYKECYGRNYDQADILKYRNYVIDRIIPLYESICSQLSRATQTAYDEFNDYYYYNLWENEDAVIELSNYFKTMKNEKYKIDMYETVNNAFKIGSIFIGSKDGIEGAYTNCSGYDQNILYFADMDYYSSALTYTHEFGHYLIPEEYLATVDYDLAETHSQSNEAMFVRYLINNNLLKTAKTFELIFLSVNLETIITTCMLDEFEESLYKNTSSLNKIYQDGISTSEYDSLIKDIENKYDYKDGLTNWDYYFCVSSCYEISYGLSQLPCLGIFAESKTDYDQAKECYYKVLTYYDSNEIKEDDTYIDVLTKCGYLSPFSDELYDLLDQTYGTK